MRWATSGVGDASATWCWCRCASGAGADITHIPYQGGGPQLNDALSGQFEVLSTNVGRAAVAVHRRPAGSRALAVGAPARLDALPQVPTLAELGFAQANLASLFGIFAPARTPHAVVQRLNAEINRALEGRVLRERLRDAYNLPAVGSVDAFAREIALDRQHNRELVAGHAALFD